MASGGAIKSVPIINLVKVDYTNTLGSVKHKNQKRVITLRSNVLNGYTPTAVNQVLGGLHRANVPQHFEDQGV